MRKDWRKIIDRFQTGKRNKKRVELSSPQVASVTRVRLIQTYRFDGIRQEGSTLVLFK